jgi:hypothetical protein
MAGNPQSELNDDDEEFPAFPFVPLTLKSGTWRLLAFRPCGTDQQIPPETAYFVVTTLADCLFA